MAAWICLFMSKRRHGATTRSAELIKLPVLLKRCLPVSYRRMEDGGPAGSRSSERVRWRQAGCDVDLASSAHREENIGHHINECHVRSSVPSLIRSPPEKITHFYDHPKERKDREREGKMVSLVRVVCRDGRAIEQTTRPVQTDARPNKMGFCGWWCMHMKSHVHRVVASGVKVRILSRP